ncbi:TrgA family protein [Pararhodobacter sp. SW119]|uniref:TrgA family protein n=1 Tax=Pararhodobacter sp. SW119 TaxID=2780075 RepID=UPI001ADF2663|nr:TrgA family protein [Pararhodobacter sp. SW119]
MFTLIRPLSALVLAILAIVAAEAYRPLFAEGAQLGGLNLWVAGIAAVIGFGYLGPRVDHGFFWTLYYTAQAVVLTALVAALGAALRMVFVHGYRRVYREPMDAVEGFVDQTLRFMAVAMDRSFLLLLGGGALICGIVLWLLFRLLERRRLAR